MSKELNDVLCKRIAGLSLTGATSQQIARELKLTVQKVSYLMRQDAFKDETEKLLSKVNADIVGQARSQLGMLLPKAVRAIERKLEEDCDLKAAEIVLKGIGVFSEEEKQSEATSITVVMPGGNTHEIIDVTPDKED